MQVTCVWETAGFIQWKVYAQLESSIVNKNSNHICREQVVSAKLELQNMKIELQSLIIQLTEKSLSSPLLENHIAPLTFNLSRGLAKYYNIRKN